MSEKKKQKFVAAPKAAVAPAPQPQVVPPPAPVSSSPPPTVIGELDVGLASAMSWFKQTQTQPFVLIPVAEQHTKDWVAALGVALRRCYITDKEVLDWSKARGVSAAEIVASKLPDPGSVMAGDFGEFVVFLFQSASVYPQKAIGPKKWRLKQDRTKAAPYSDVIHFVLPQWPTPSAQDQLLCAEVKTKATDQGSTPIPDAIEDSTTKDRTGRLAKTLVWLKDRSMTQDLGEVTGAHLDRFIQSTAHPPAQKVFRAVAVVCESVLKNELKTVPRPLPAECSLVVLAVPKLQGTYTAVFGQAKTS
jgi:hypothetical protein